MRPFVRFSLLACLCVACGTPVAKPGEGDDAADASSVTRDAGRVDAGNTDAGVDAGEPFDAGPCANSGGRECGGKCVDAHTDRWNCGECGNECVGEEQCIDGECQCETAGEVQCNGLCYPSELAACICEQGGTKLCGASNQCVDALHDDHNCGECGNVCWRAGNGGVCEQGDCCAGPELTCNEFVSCCSGLICARPDKDAPGTCCAPGSAIWCHL